MYNFLKVIARLAIRIYCRKIIINNPALLQVKGPLLLAANHPNSFLDSIIINTLIEQPVWSLARGDVFKKPFYRKLLHRLKILPVYRTSEGVQNLPENYKTFEDCLEIFRKKGIVMIFSEARCVNEWQLRPLKKGTARLVAMAHENQIPLQVLPVGINYSSFRRFGKNVFINFGHPITLEHLPSYQPDGLKHLAFNQLLEDQLKGLVFEIGKTDIEKQRVLLERKPSITESIALFVPALAGCLTHLPFYLPIKYAVLRLTKNNDHYDSVLNALLIILYPFYLLFVVLMCWLVFKSWLVLTLVLLLPVLAWSCVRIKPQLDKSSYQSYTY